MTTQERKELLTQAQAIRQEQAKIREAIQAGRLDATSVLVQRNTNKLMGRMRLGYLLMSIKGVGKFKANKMAEKWGLTADTRLEALTLAQVITIAEEVSKLNAPKPEQPAATSTPAAATSTRPNLIAEVNVSDFSRTTNGNAASTAAAARA